MMRSNYFAVKNKRTFLTFCRRRGFEPLQNDEKLHGFCGVDPLGFQSEDDEDDNSDMDYPFMDKLADLLADGHVAIIMEVGHDKMRYMDGTAWAINNKHENRKVDLSDIYKLAEQLGAYVTYALY